MNAAGLFLLIALGANGQVPDLTAPGNDPARGVLVNCTLGMDRRARPDPTRPAIVFAHGANPTSRFTHFEIAERLGEMAGTRYGDSISILGWNWNSGTIVGFGPRSNIPNAAAQGRKLGASIQALGLDPRQVHLIGHSAGTIVVSSAARYLKDKTGQPVAQVTLLEPATFHHAVIFQELGVVGAARYVEHYWVPGPSGFGKQATAPGVRDYRVELTERTGWLGLLQPAYSDHMNLMRWYLSTVGAGSMGGFTECVFLAKSAKGDGLPSEPSMHTPPLTRASVRRWGSAVPP